VVLHHNTVPTTVQRSSKVCGGAVFKLMESFRGDVSIKTVHFFIQHLHIRPFYCTGLKPSTHGRRRRDSTVQLSRDGGVYRICNYSRRQFCQQLSRVASCIGGVNAPVGSRVVTQFIISRAAGDK